MCDSEPLVKKQKLENNGDDMWRKTAPDFLHLFRVMFEKEIHTDVTIKVELGFESRQIECHSLILSAHSPVFSTMLSERWNGDKTENRKLVTLKDDDLDHFSFFVKMMYWDWKEDNLKNYNIPAGVTPELAVGVLSIAHKYLAYHVIRLAEHLIFSILSKRLANDTVKLYTLLNELQICQKGEVARKTLWTVQNCLLADGENIFSSDAILQLNQMELNNNLNRFDLKCPERIIFQGCLRWAQEQCKIKKLENTVENVRSILGETTKYIRFNLLDNATITNEVIPSKILAQEDMIELLTYFVNKNCPVVKEKFSASKRIDSKKMVVSRLSFKSSTLDNAVDFSSPQGFTMTLSKNMCLRAMLFFCGDNVPRNYKIFVEFEVLNKKFAANHEIKDFISTDAKSVVFFPINPGVKIPENIPVNVKFTITGGSKRVTADLVDNIMKEILYWKDEVIFITFKSSPHLLNGLKQVPTLYFTDETDD